MSNLRLQRLRSESTLLLVLFLFFFVSTHSEARNPLLTTVTLIDTNPEELALRIQVKNTSSRPLFVWDSTLPWSIGDGMKCYAIPTRRPAAPLPQLFGFESGIGFIRIGPGETLEDVIPAGSKVRDLEGARTKAEFYLFWAHRWRVYTQPDLQKKPLEFTEGGVLVVPQRKLAQKRH